jgi:hypothetical protein
MNRDERYDRVESKNMCVTKNFAHPCDAKKGGTCFGINRHGIIMALLNRYDIYYKKTNLSRGRFIPELLSFQTITDVIDAFHEMHMPHDNPFEIFLISKSKAVCIRWDGELRTTKEFSLAKPLLFTSSSANPKAVSQFRKKLFKEFIQNTGANEITSDVILHNLHMRYMPNMLSSAILMRRNTTHTKSITQAVLSDYEISISYWPEEVIADKIHANNYS